MAEKFTLQHGGRRYEVERRQPRRQAATGGGAPVGTDLVCHAQPHGGGIYLGGG